MNLGVNAPRIHASLSCVVRILEVNVHRHISLASSIKGTHMADELWSRFVHALQREGLRYEDLPETEILVYGTPEELGFPNLLDRTKLKKQIFQRNKECAKCRTADQMDPCSLIGRVSYPCKTLRTNQHKNDVHQSH